MGKELNDVFNPKNNQMNGSLDLYLVVAIAELLVVGVVEGYFNNMKDKVEQEGTKYQIRLSFLQNYISILLLNEVFGHDCVHYPLCSAYTWSLQQFLELPNEVKSDENQGYLNGKDDDLADSLLLIAPYCISDKLNNNKRNQGDNGDDGHNDEGSDHNSSYAKGTIFYHALIRIA